MKTLLSTICLFFSISIAVSGQGIHKLWGTTPYGGKDNAGVIFSLDGRGRNLQKEYEFVTEVPGDSPEDMKLTNYQGKFYGTTRYGGQNNDGIIFEWDPITNIFRKRFDFESRTTGYGPRGELKLMNGKFYGATNFGIYEWDPVTNLFEVKHKFNGGEFNVDGIWLVAHENTFYGSLEYGGTYGKGILFEWDPVNNQYTNKQDFDGLNNGGAPLGALSYYNGKFYGVTRQGGVNDVGVIFEWDAVENVLVKKKDFEKGVIGCNPGGSLIIRNGKFYGMTEGTVECPNSIFEWDPVSNQLKKRTNIFYGSSQRKNLTLHEDKFYGMTLTGGDNGDGVIFEWDPNTDQLTKRIDFDRVSKGSWPFGPLTYMNGKFYGVTNYGGQGGRGGIFEWDPETNYFENKIDFRAEGGCRPFTLSTNGSKVYGMTQFGGNENYGVIFEWDPMEKNIYKKQDFGERIASIYPSSSLFIKDNDFYGVGFSYGYGEYGTIFKWDPENNSFIKKVSFTNQLDHGFSPSGDLSLWKDKFYGVTSFGGANGDGVIFEWDPNNDLLTKISDFEVMSLGRMPHGNLALFNGKFYGTAMYGGVENVGVIFQMDPVTKTLLKVYDFKYFDGGSYPIGGLTLFNGKLYGMTNYGGNYFRGAIFEFDPETNNYIPKVHLNGVEKGDSPSGELLFHNNKFYGVTEKGGDHGYGIVFEWDPVTNLFSKTVDFNSKNGISPYERLAKLVSTPAPTAKGTPGSCLQLPSLTIDATNNNEWVPISDDKGEAIAEIKANGNVLGNVAVSLYVHDGAVREDSYRKLFLDRNITITPTNQPTTPVDVRFYVRKPEFEAFAEAKNSLDLSSGVDAIARVGIYKTSENSCQSGAVQLSNPVTTVSGTWSEDYVLSASISSFSTFYFAHYDNTPLPLNLISFKAQLQGKDGLLNWKTAEEVNVSHFEVERSVDGKVFSYLGTVPMSSKGDNGIYRLVDKDVAELLSGTAYYRLKMVDKDGTFSRSSMISLALPEGGSFVSIYPNPVSTKLSVDLKKSGAVSWIITDVNGKQLTSGKSENRQFEIDTQQFSAGLYFLQVTSESLVKTVKFIKH